ncbi:MAG: hypothetical protein EOO01_09945 [Chitinophagaceae bacterium]|nr:MAG: hypothetical protein EOO01_09945 [Chitinophagaceae bacterium]
MQDLAALVARLGGSDLTADAIQKMKTAQKTKSVKLPNRVPVDLRYETIVAENGALHIYRDVYERGTNTLENAKSILQIYAINYDQLSEQEKRELQTALDEMNRDARGNAMSTDTIPPTQNGVPASKITRAEKGKVTPRLKGEKVVQLLIAALKGKGYPATVNLVDGK